MNFLLEQNFVLKQLYEIGPRLLGVEMKTRPVKVTVRLIRNIFKLIHLESLESEVKITLIIGYKYGCSCYIQQLGCVS